MKILISGAVICAMLCQSAVLYAQAPSGAGSYTLGPDSQPQPGVAKGVVTRYVLPPGRIYPGTPHNYQLYIPAKYDAAKPTPFMIFLDGSGAAGNAQRVPVVFDNLIAKGELPPLIGIFIDPGVMPPLSPQAMGRYNRTYEYDSINGRYAQFLEEELLPVVAKQYNLSKNPDDHAIAGVSTGAVCAFISAWERPDMFHRVLSFIGTYVSMKGADSLPAAIRRTEPKPIRFFLQDGSNDHIVPGQPYGTFYGGSWPINNQVMYEAMEFAGYDAKLVIGNEAHNMKQGAAIMPEALRWLWRDYPKPIVAGQPAAMGQPGWDPRGQAYGVIEPGKPWEAVGETYLSVASPAADRQGNVFFADPRANRIYKSNPEGKVTLFKDGTRGATALRFGPDGLLYASQPASKRIVAYGPSGEEKPIAQDVSADDLAVTVKNDIYFVDAAHRSVGLVRAGSHKAVLFPMSDMLAPAVLTLSPDQAMLDVGDSASRFSWSFQIGTDGAPINGEPLFRVDMPELSRDSHVAGATMDSIGQVYFATGLGIQFCEQNGRCAAVLAKPELHGEVTNLAFGGPELSWLYVAEGKKLYRREVKSRGVAAWAPVTPPKPPL